MIRYIILGSVIAALMAPPALGAKLDRKCLREMGEIFGATQARRVCNPDNYVSNPDEYGWVCVSPQSGKLAKLKGQGAKQQRDAVCE